MGGTLFFGLSVVWDEVFEVVRGQVVGKVLQCLLIRVRVFDTYCLDSFLRWRFAFGGGGDARRVIN